MAAILVVDDEQTILHYISKVLAHENHEVVTVADGNMGRERIESEPFDLVLSDLMMPGVDGLALLRWARSKRPELPFVMVTAYASADVAAELVALGAYDLVVKPFGVCDLPVITRNALEDILAGPGPGEPACSSGAHEESGDAVLESLGMGVPGGRVWRRQWTHLEAYLGEHEGARIRQVLECCGNDPLKAAKALKLAPEELEKKLAKLKISGTKA